MYYSANHLIPSFPFEVAAMIFIECVQSSQRDEATNPRLAPPTLAAVSRPWQQLAYNTSQLWSTCWLCYRRQELNGIWLSHAGNLKLTLDGSRLPPNAPKLEPQVWQTPGFAYPPGLFHAEHSEVYSSRPFLASIAPYMKHCVSFSIHHSHLSTENGAATYDFQDTYLANVRILDSDYPTRYPYWLRQLVYCSQGFKGFRLNHSSESYGMFPPVYNPSGLTHVTLSAVHRWGRLFSFLEKAKQVRTLTIINMEPLEDEPQLHNPIVHTSLVRLELRLQLDDIIIAFESLTLPPLRSLNLEVEISHDQADEEYATSLVDLLERSKCKLRELGLDREDNAVSILQRQEFFSSLEVLRCANFDITRELLCFLSNSSNLPRLRRLSFNEAGLWDTNNVSLMADMVHARRAGDGAGKECSNLEYLKFTLYFSNFRPEQQSKVVSDCARILAVARSSQDEVNPFVADIMQWAD